MNYSFKKKIISRNKNNNRQNMSFTNFIIRKKRHIEQKIMGNTLNRSSNQYNLSKLKLYDINFSNSFNKNTIEKTYEFNLFPKLEEKMTTLSENRFLDNINNNIYEKKVMNTFSLKSYKDKKN